MNLWVEVLQNTDILPVQRAGFKGGTSARANTTMKSGRRGATGMSARETSRPQHAARRGKRGRPPVHDEAWTKVTVVLFNRQIVFLDRLAANIRAQSGAAISRAQLIRSLVDALSEADIDLTASQSEADLKATLLARLGRYRLAP